jgi:hypothetical protein
MDGKQKYLVSDDIKGCSLCGDFPVILSGKCHPSAPLRVELYEDNVMIFYCYDPQCNREVFRTRILKG